MTPSSPFAGVERGTQTARLLLLLIAEPERWRCTEELAREMQMDRGPERRMNVWRAAAPLMLRHLVEKRAMSRADSHPGVAVAEWRASVHLRAWCAARRIAYQRADEAQVQALLDEPPQRNAVSALVNAPLQVSSEGTCVPREHVPVVHATQLGPWPCSGTMGTPKPRP